MDLKELTAYLLKSGETPSKVQEVLTALDADGDGQVSRDEWRKGWAAGTAGINAYKAH